MRILKEYETKINLSATEMFSGILSDDNYIMNFLRKQFEGRCMDSSFVTNIKSIKARSLVSIDKNDLGGRGSICVVFRAEAVVYPPNSVIVGAQVASIERDGRIMCKYDNALIHLRGDRKFAPAKGDLIPVLVLRTGYPVGSDNMSIAAQPYLIAPTFNMRLTQTENLTDEERDLISRKLVEIADSEKLFQTLPASTRQFFEALFYPYNDPELYATVKTGKPDKPDKPDKLKSPFESVDIIALANKAVTSATVSDVKVPRPKTGEPTVFSRHSAITKSSTLALQIDIATVKLLPTGPWTDRTKIEVKLTAAAYADMIIEFLDDYCTWLNLIIDCCGVYNTEAIRKSHNKLWTIYGMLKS